MSSEHVVPATRPTVSIGFAVYNGERYLSTALESLLAQSYADFEIVLCDNASTDGTGEICREFAARDARIRYYRNATNIGGANNENLTFQRSRGRYFRLAAHDDYCAPTLLERLVEVLDSCDEIVLCHAGAVSVDEWGGEHDVVYREAGTEATPSARFRSLSARDHWCEATYGLIRSDILRLTQLQKDYTNSDRVLLCELAAFGRFELLREPLFYKRYHSGNEYKDWRARMVWFMPDLATTGKSTFPNWLEFFDYVRLTSRCPLPIGERCRWAAGVLGWAVRQRSDLLHDLTSALKHRFRSRSARVGRYESEDSWR